MILYFTGTGNSQYVAERIATALGDQLLSMNDRIKLEYTSPIKTSERLVIVTPTYAWRIPHLVENWLHRMEFPGARQGWFVMTCGSEIGNAAKYNRRLCEEKQLTYMGTAQIVMPENYIAMFNTPQAEEARQIIVKAEPDIDRAVSAIREDLALPLPRNSLYDRFMSGPVNSAFYALFVKDKAFIVSEACVGCGQCASLCPTNNITLQDGKPVWGSDCTHCMACICHCPIEAIEYGKKSASKPRYRMENVFLKDGQE